MVTEDCGIGMDGVGGSNYPFSFMEQRVFLWSGMEWK